MAKLLKYLEFVYGAKAKPLERQLNKLLHGTAQSQCKSSQDYWYKFVELYCVYPDGVIYDSSLSPLQNLTQHLKRIKNLGCNAVHILPFLASPGVDKGFDISDYYTIREDLGSLKDLQQLVQEAHRLGMRLFMDFVFNHVSDQHPWFQKAQQGDGYYRNYFIHTLQKPQFIRKFYQDSAIWAEYIVEGQSKIINIAFPEHAGAIPHWRQGKDGYWYYHTYYPTQLDLNWLNPDVFLEVTKILIHWVKLGFNFRLDAIPFIGKNAYKLTDASNKVAHAITAALKCITDKIDPSSVFIIESYEQLDKVIEYFGSSEIVQANLSYNFHLCTSIWVSLIKADANYIWQKLDKLVEVPDHAEWLNFMRNHDELSLAYLPDDLLLTMREAIGKYGKDFREGCGISGRTFSLLGGHQAKFLMAYFLLASLPGGIVIPYGDEIACPNIALDKLIQQDRADSRNINRGRLLSSQYETQEGKAIFRALTMIIRQRKALRYYLNIWPMRLGSAHCVFAACYKNSHEELLIYINLSEEPQEIECELLNARQCAQVNEPTLKKGMINLGPYAGIWLKRRFV
ncbi:MAG: Malto-oligosyltrehalose trehalohydrolase [Gammaproteobacteria bacterium]|nr:Malto-oligosyltrehalose trehalohydrolase [Gammaproteobacteria bacterium]